MATTRDAGAGRDNGAGDLPRHQCGSCYVAPDPRLLGRLRQHLEDLASDAADSDAGLHALLRIGERRAFGLNDGVVRPLSDAADGASFSAAKAAAAQRTPMRGAVNVVVVLVDFEDQPFVADPKQRFEDLFFSSTPGAASVRGFYGEASGGLVTISGAVAGPYRMPQKLAYYADNASGKTARVQELPLDALKACDADINFAPYDNDGDGYVDSYVVVHAGTGAEQTGNKSDIWSHKSILPDGRPYETDGVSVFAYLTVPEDARLGVCAHELGHLLFAWPDLYDTDYSSSGLGDFCLMAGGSWNGGGDVPAHPSAWCKSTQEWVTVVNHIGSKEVTIEGVDTSRTVHRLWTKGARTSEYFLVENRRATGFDRDLPGTGLLLYHVDESIDSNDNEQHPKIALMQADGLQQLQQKNGVADAGDPFPGTTDNRTCDDTSNPSTRAYSGKRSGISLSDISPNADAITVTIRV